MKRNQTILSVLLLCIICSCNKVITAGKLDSKPPLPENSPVFTYILGDNIDGEVEIIGPLNIRTAKNRRCNVEDIQKKAEQIARENGGNALLIDKVEVGYGSSLFNLCLDYTTYIASINSEETLFASVKMLSKITGKKSTILSNESMKARVQVYVV